MNLKKKLIAAGMAVLLIGFILGQAVQTSAYQNKGYIQGKHRN